ncbi:hypothetical protein RF11_16496 [Thelohanellus kitauei]|uniref:BPTI/Kunitz inhibitor domain-containing protein n=1 Tax=Thelohanellus kitauei TaxID=669202 RepID=A0A0C2N7Y0_THEKT|nr:hypothetical protein RF11_16496 [Thelohanellus kitauei]
MDSPKGNYDTDCEDNITSYYFDIETKKCKKLETCEKVHHPSVFENLFECKLECYSIAWVKTPDCLIDWGMPNYEKDMFPKARYMAFNPRIGYCLSYIEIPGYSEPKLFDDWEDCLYYCHVNAQKYESGIVE